MREAGGGSGPKDAQRGDLCVGACLPDRHCERSEAIQALSADAVWIASSQGLLAITSLWLGSRTTIRYPLTAPRTSSCRTAPSGSRAASARIEAALQPR